MYQVYAKTPESYDGRKLIGEFKDIESVHEKIEKELAENEEFKYVIEETTGKVDVYGELIADVVEEN